MRKKYVRLKVKKIKSINFKLNYNNLIKTLASFIRTIIGIEYLVEQGTFSMNEGKPRAILSQCIPLSSCMERREVEIMKSIPGSITKGRGVRY